MLFPMAPREVRTLRPTEVAAILGLDLVDAIEVVAPVDFIDTGGHVPEELLTPTGSRARPPGETRPERRLRKVMSIRG